MFLSSQFSQLFARIDSLGVPAPGPIRGAFRHLVAPVPQGFFGGIRPQGFAAPSAGMGQVVAPRMMAMAPITGPRATSPAQVTALGYGVHPLAAPITGSGVPRTGPISSRGETVAPIAVSGYRMERPAGAVPMYGAYRGIT